MKISDLIEALKDIQEEYGDITVCVSEGHDYWGDIQRHLDECDVRVSDHAQPEGPKSGVSEKAVVFEY